MIKIKRDTGPRLTTAIFQQRDNIIKALGGESKQINLETECLYIHHSDVNQWYLRCMSV